MATVTRRVPITEVPKAWREGLGDAPIVDVTLTTDLNSDTAAASRPPGEVMREVQAVFQAVGGCEELPLPPREPITFD